MSQEKVVEALEEFETVDQTNEKKLMSFVEKWNPVIGREGGVVTKALGLITDMRKENSNPDFGDQ